MDSFVKKNCFLITYFASFFLPDGTALDGDDPEHIQWIFQKSLERASQYNITGVTYRLTQGKAVTHHE